MRRGEAFLKYFVGHRNELSIMIAVIICWLMASSVFYVKYLYNLRLVRVFVGKLKMNV